MIAMNKWQDITDMEVNKGKNHRYQQGRLTMCIKRIVGSSIAILQV